MAVIRLVRHGEAASGWDGDLDPGLSRLGRRQAAAAADLLAPLPPASIVTSPLLRARETAAPLADRWGREPRVEPAVGEIVAPADAAGLQARAAWLRRAMAGAWSDLGREHHDWRDHVVEHLLAMEEDTVVFSHFVAINVAVGAATSDDRVVCFTPANASITRLRNDDGRLVVEELGGERETQVL